MSKSDIEVSKFLSYVLRHEPSSIGLTLDREGWVDIDALIICANKHGKPLNRELISRIVSTNDKKRFAISEDERRIRAVQGHSTDLVTLSLEEKIPPAFLYHGTATRFLDSILRDGLKPGERHYVHLSQDPNTASTVGQRHGKPAVLKIAALRKHQLGHKFFQAENGVWLTEHVPQNFISK